MKLNYDVLPVIDHITGTTRWVAATLGSGATHTASAGTYEDAVKALHNVVVPYGWELGEDMSPVLGED